MLTSLLLLYTNFVIFGRSASLSWDNLRRVASLQKAALPAETAVLALLTEAEECGEGSEISEDFWMRRAQMKVALVELQENLTRQPRLQLRIFGKLQLVSLSAALALLETTLKALRAPAVVAVARASEKSRRARSWQVREFLASEVEKSPWLTRAAQQRVLQSVGSAVFRLLAKLDADDQAKELALQPWTTLFNCTGALRNWKSVVSGSSRGARRQRLKEATADALQAVHTLHGKIFHFPVEGPELEFALEVVREARKFLTSEATQLLIEFEDQFALYSLI